MGIETVTVACNLPGGLIAEVCDFEIVDERGEKTARHKGQPRRFVFQGPKAQRLLERDGVTIGQAPNVHGAYGLTQVEREFAERWFEENKESPLVTNGHVMMHAKAASAAKMAEERGKSNRRGGAYEPIKPTEIDPKSGKITSGEIDPRTVRGVHTADKPAEGM